ncbi:MAG TPA: hypothetical protein VKF14_13955 [Candidatus Dormibacteraeota bacterium]|nr:hypothetical protein [Candidatus Dormibacteraeota bacterium]
MPKLGKALRGDQFFPPPAPAPLEPEEDPEAPRFWREWEQAMNPPADELGSELPVRVQLCKRDQQSIWLLALIVHSTGFLMRLGGFSDPGRRPAGPPTLDRLGIVFADGRAATSRDRLSMDETPLQPILRRQRRSTGAFSRSEETYWVFGIPPVGNIRLHYVWSGDGSRRHVIELDSEPVRQLAP